MRGRLKIGVKLILSFGLMIALLLLVGSVGFFGLRYVHSEVESFASDNRIASFATDTVQNVLSGQREMLSYLLDGDNDKLYETAVKENADAKEAFEKIKKELGPEDAELHKIAELVGPLLDKTVQDAVEIHRLFDGRKQGDAARRVTGQEVNKGFDAIDAYLKKKAEGVKPENAEELAAIKAHQDELFTAKFYRQDIRLELRNIEIGKTAKARDDAENRRGIAFGNMVAPLNRMSDKPIDNEEKKLLDALLTKTVDWSKAASPFKDESNKIRETQDQWKTTAQECIAQCEAIFSTASQQVLATEKEVDETVQFVVCWIIGVSIFAVVVGIAMMFVLNRSISHKMIFVTDMLGRVVGDGDFNVVVEPALLQRQDEIGRLARTTENVLKDYRGVSELAQALADGDWTREVSLKGDKDLMNINLKNMVEKVNDALLHVASVVEQVASGAREASSASDSLSQGATTSAASLEEITSSMGEVGSQTNTNAGKATEANRLAKSATTSATEGKDMMQKMISSMELITKNAGDVQRVIKVIDDISFQTNLLALNAAVEAARAGVHGKGFAVVAEEVRNLAARCAKAAGETSQMIENNNKQIGQGAEIAMKTSDKLDSIVEQSEKTAGLINDIATASNEQAQGIQQISQGLQQIDSVTQQNTASAEETASVSREMSSSAETLQSLIGQFKLRQAKHGSITPSVATSAVSSPQTSTLQHMEPARHAPENAIKIDLSMKPAVHATKPVLPQNPVAAKPAVSTKPIATKPVVPTKPFAAKPAVPTKPATPGSFHPKPRVEQNPNQFPAEPTHDVKGGWGGVPHDQKISINLDDKSFLDDKNFGKY